MRSFYLPFPICDALRREFVIIRALTRSGFAKHLEHSVHFSVILATSIWAIGSTPSTLPRAAAHGEFTITAWVNANDGEQPGGALVAKYDAVRRKGFILSLATRTGVTHSQANVKQLHFGIDDGSKELKWVDHGRPGNAVYIHALAAHDGELFAGTCEAGASQTGHVYRYDGENRWVDCGSPDRSNAVISLAAYRGRLFAGTGKYRLAGSSLPESKNTNRGGRVCRYEGGKRWTTIGELPESEAIGGLVVFKDHLHANSLYRPAGFFRFEPGADNKQLAAANHRGNWIRLPLPEGGKRVESLGVFGSSLFATSYDNGHVYRFDGNSWSDTGAVGDNTQTYGFAQHDGELYVSTWPSGRVFRRQPDRPWLDVGRLGNELEVMGMASYNGQLYAGTLPNAQVYRFSGDGNWQLTGQLDRTPGVKYRRAWSMAEFQGRLFVGTLPSGGVFSAEAGKCVSYDREFPPGWHHVAAVRRKDRLELFLDGKLVARSTPFNSADLDISNETPLRIAAEETVRAVRVDARALEPGEIQDLATRGREDERKTIEELVESVAKLERELACAQRDLAEARAELAVARNQPNIAVSELRKVEHFYECERQCIESMGGRICSEGPFRIARRNLATVRARIAEMENRTDALVVELLELIAYHEWDANGVRDLLRKQQMSPAQAKELLGESEKTLAELRKRLKSAREKVERKKVSGMFLTTRLSPGTVARSRSG